LFIGLYLLDDLKFLRFTDGDKYYINCHLKRAVIRSALAANPAAFALAAEGPKGVFQKRPNAPFFFKNLDGPHANRD
jgi:hypothetical protein